MIKPSWFSGSFISFFYSSVYSCHFFLISSASVRSITFMSFIEPIFAWNSLGISNYLEEITSLSHSVVFLYFFALIIEESFFISPCYSLELCIQMGISFLVSFALASAFFSAICKASSENHFPFLHFFFLGMVLITASCIMLWTSIHRSSDLIPWIYLSLPLYNCKGFDLGHTCMV